MIRLCQLFRRSSCQAETSTSGSCRKLASPTALPAAGKPLRGGQEGSKPELSSPMVLALSSPAASGRQACSPSYSSVFRPDGAWPGSKNQVLTMLPLLPKWRMQTSTSTTAAQQILASHLCHQGLSVHWHRLQ